MSEEKGPLMLKVESDMKEAMKAQQKDRLEAIRFLKAMLLENKTSKNPKSEMDVIIAHKNKLAESLNHFPKDNPIYPKTVKEIEIISVYLPQALSEDEVKAKISEIVKANPSANSGMIMKELSPQIKGKFDGKKANLLVQEALKA
ncbi:MAG: GatB/YqeY domain-containing protein [Bacteriovoracales bacterium]